MSRPDSSSEAVGGFTVTIDNCWKSPASGNGVSDAASAMRCVVHVPAPTGSSTRCPMGNVTPSPTAAMRPMASLPPMAGSGGSMPYCPVSVSTSDGLIGRCKHLDQCLSRTGRGQRELDALDHILWNGTASSVLRALHDHDNLGGVE